LIATGCRTAHKPAPGTEAVTRSQPLLGTFVVVSAYGTNRAAIHEAISAAFDEVRRADAMMSIHREDSELARVNAQAALGPVKISPELFRVVALAQSVARETEGSFDVTIRPLADLWGFIWKEYRLPTANELAVVLPRVDYRHVELNENESTVRFRTNGVSLDLGGVGKGFAVDLAVAKLQQLGINNALVRAGGDLRVIGAPPGENAWEVQIEDPMKSGRRTSIRLRDAAISTSGNYENSFIINGRRYSHLLNPKTGLPVEGMAACSVIAPTCAESDAWATALFVYGVEQSLARFRNRFSMRFVLVEASGAFVVRESGFPPSLPVNAR
jgi:thiamine biosynthesis lipoprotein